MNLIVSIHLRWTITIDFQWQDAEKLPFKDNTFDVVVSRNLLWTRPNPGKALREWRRVMKPAGALVVSDGMWMNCTWNRVHHLAFKVVRGMLSNGSMVSLRFFLAYASLQKKLPFYEGIGITEIQTLFQVAGFREIKSHDTAYFDTNPYGRNGSRQREGFPFFIVHARK